MRLFTQNMPHFLEPSVPPQKKLKIGLCEFFMGPEGSGSPVHWHVAAMNFLARGTKQWFLAPPRFSFHSRTPAKLWWHNKSHARPQPNSERTHLNCEQTAGDILFVPRFWAHSVLNSDFVSGFALEFETPVTIPTVEEPSILQH